MNAPATFELRHRTLPRAPKDPLARSLVRLLKHKLVRRFTPRVNRVYTQFYRFPHQYDATVDRVIPHVSTGGCGRAEKPLQILMFGCCSGAEAFSLSSVLLHRCPALHFQIRAFDIVPNVIEKANLRQFTRDEVYQGPFVFDDFVTATFDIVDDHYVVKDLIANPISFAVGDVLDASFIQRLGSAEMVIAQNMLFHLPPANARRAFTNLVSCMAPRSALFVNGMDTDMRISLTQKYGLDPLDHLVEEIHEDARVDRGDSWASAYWGREPFSREPKDWLRKYGTIFLRSR